MLSYYVGLGLVVPLCVSWVLLHTGLLLSHYFDFECYKYTQTHTQGLAVVPLYVSWVAQVLAAALARLSGPSSYSPPNQRARGSPVCTRGGGGVSPGDGWMDWMDFYSLIIVHRGAVIYPQFAPGGGRRSLPRGCSWELRECNEGGFIQRGEPTF